MMNTAIQVTLGSVYPYKSIQTSELNNQAIISFAITMSSEDGLSISTSVQMSVLTDYLNSTLLYVFLQGEQLAITLSLFLLMTVTSVGIYTAIAVCTIYLYGVYFCHSILCS